MKIFIATEDEGFERDLIKTLSSEDVLKYYCLKMSKYRSLKTSSIEKITLYLYERTIECDVFVYDLNSISLKNLEIHLKIFKNLDLLRTKKLIIISNIMTWAQTQLISSEKEEDDNISIINDIRAQKNQRVKNLQSELSQKESDDKNSIEVSEDEEIPLELEEDEIDEEEQNGEDDQDEPSPDYAFFSEEDFLNRKSEIKFMPFISLENLALDLHKNKKNFKVNILCPGVVYGHQKSVLRNLVEISWLQDPHYLYYIERIEEDQFFKFHHLHQKQVKFFQKFKFLAPVEEQAEEEKKQSGK